MYVCDECYGAKKNDTARLACRISEPGVRCDLYAVDGMYFSVDVKGRAWMNFLRATTLHLWSFDAREHVNEDALTKYAF
jgi:hypothetical protein